MCSDSSNPSISQCMFGRPVVQWSAVAMLYTVVFLQSLDIVFVCVVFSLGKKKKKKKKKKRKKSQRAKSGE